MSCAPSHHVRLHATVSSLLCMCWGWGWGRVESRRNSWNFPACLRAYTFPMALLNVHLGDWISPSSTWVSSHSSWNEVANKQPVIVLPTKIYTLQGFRRSLSVPIHERTLCIDFPKTQNHFLLFSSWPLTSCVLHYTILSSNKLNTRTLTEPFYVVASEDTVIKKLDTGPISYVEVINLNPQIQVCKKYFSVL